MGFYNPTRERIAQTPLMAWHFGELHAACKARVNQVTQTVPQQIDG